MAERFPHTTIQCLAAVAQHHRLAINPERLIEDYALQAEEPPIATVLRIGTDIGLKIKADKLSWENLQAQGGVFPLIARMENGNCVIVMAASPEGGGQVAVLNPLADNPTEVLMIERDKFSAHWKGDVFLMKRVYSATEEKQPFGFRWFIPEILKQKAAFRDIAIAAIALHFLGLASPMFFQLVIDKVLVHQSASTLWTLGVGVTIALVFESVFGF